MAKSKYQKKLVKYFFIIYREHKATLEVMAQRPV